MTTTTFLPHPLLQSCIQAYVYTELEAGKGGTSFDLFPTGYPMLVFNLNQEATFQDVHSRVVYNHRLHFVGQLTRHRRIKMLTNPACINIIFRPAGAFRLFGGDQSHLVDDSFDVRDVMQAGADDTLHQLEDAGQNLKKIIQILENRFLKLWRQNDSLATEQIEEACGKIICRSGTLSIRSLCREIGMSKSSLEAHFKLKTGITPKMYNRITRFNQALQQMKAYSAADCQELIFRLNYFDQSHFIREFKSFYGYTPSHVHASFQNLSKAIKEQAERELPVL